MTVPKRRQSKMKGRLRRTHYKASAPTLTHCPSCGVLIPPHRVCPECFGYRNRLYKQVKEVSELMNDD